MKVMVLGGDGFCGWPTALHLLCAQALPPPTAELVAALGPAAADAAVVVDAEWHRTPLHVLLQV